MLKNADSSRTTVSQLQQGGATPPVSTPATIPIGVQGKYIIAPGDQNPDPPERLPREGLDIDYTGSYDGIYAYSLRYPTFSLDPLLSRKGYQFVENMMDMAACRSPFDLKRYAVLQDGWEIVPCYVDPKHPDHERSKELADAMRYALNNIRDEDTDFTQDLLSVLFEMMFGAWTGNKFLEIDWAYQKHGKLKGKHGFRGIYAKSNRQIAFDVDPLTMVPKNFTSYTPDHGYNFRVPVEKGIWYVHNQTNNFPQGTGDWRACHKHWMSLEGNYIFWAQALERWGAPVFITQIPQGSQAEFDAVQRAVNEIRQGAPPVLPMNAKYDLVTAPQQVFIGFEAACRFHIEQISINVVGNTLTTGAGDNSLALGQVHQQTGATYDDALSKFIENSFFNQVIRRFVRYNYGADAVDIAPRLVLKKRLETDMLKMAQMLQILIEGGNMPARSAVIRNSLNLPAISPEEQIMLDANEKALLEAEQQVAQGRSASKTMKYAMPQSDHEWEKNIEFWANVLYHTKYLQEGMDVYRRKYDNATPLEQRAMLQAT